MDTVSEITAHPVGSVGIVSVPVTNADNPPTQERSADIPVLEDIGEYSVFVRGVTPEKRDKAIELIVEFRKCTKKEAEDLVKRLVVPVVKNVEQKSVLHIAAELEDLVARTRAGKARIDTAGSGTA